MTVICNFLISGHSDAQSRASECLDVETYKWRFNPVWHRMLYSCIRMAAVGVKGLRMFKAALHIRCVFGFDCCVYRSCIYGVTYTVAIQTQAAIETDSLSSCPQHPGFMDCLHYPAQTSSTCRNRVRLTARLHGDGSLKRMIYAAAVNCRLDCQLARPCLCGQQITSKNHHDIYILYANGRTCLPVAVCLPGSLRGPLAVCK